MGSAVDVAVGVANEAAARTDHRAVEVGVEDALMFIVRRSRAYSAISDHRRPFEGGDVVA